ncbi:MAG: FAD-dependent oxidoreductase [Coriobacteriia bacterium]
MAKYVIVGGVAGGASVAARLRRNDEHAEIVLLEKDGHVSYASCGLPYYVGGVITERSDLFVMTPEQLHDSLNIDVRVWNEVTAINREAKTVTVRNLQTGQSHDEPYDSLVLSTGALPVKPPIPGVDLPGVFTIRSVADVDGIVEWMGSRRMARAVIVGGGFVGLEMAENLSNRGTAVTLVEGTDQVMPALDFEMAAIAHRYLRASGVELRLNETVAAFEQCEQRLLVKLASGDRFPADIVVLAVGVRPNSSLAEQAGLELVPKGKPGASAIVVDDHLRTSDPNIRALGDVIAFPDPITGEAATRPLAGPANKQARLVADALVFGDDSVRSWNGTFGSAITKVFELGLGAVGSNEKTLKRLGLPHASVVVRSASHATYYPGASTVTVKLLYDPESGRILGGQVVGREGVDKRVDVISAIMSRGGTVSDLVGFEQAYAPPFSAGRDPINVAGDVADNALTGKSHPISWREFEEARQAGAFVLDVRTTTETSRGTVPGAVVIPHTELRTRLHEVPRGVPVLVYCHVGLRGYLAERILRQNGWTDVRNLTGGYSLWTIATERQDNPKAHESCHTPASLVSSTNESTHIRELGES